MKAPHPVICLLGWLLVSCGHDSSATKAPATVAAPPTLSQRLEAKNGYKQDAAGNWVPLNNQRSSFETKGTSPYFQGPYAKKTYQTNQYATKSWWGNKDYGRKQYSGNTDGSRFQKSSSLNGQSARETGTAATLHAPYQTGSYATKTAREASAGAIAKPSDAATDARRKVFVPPEIIDWKQQRSLSVEQSKGLLGH